MRSIFNRLRFARWSITWQLSFYFALGSLALITAMGAYLYSVLDRRLDEEHTVFLADDVDLIRHTLGTIDSYDALTQGGSAAAPLPLMESRLTIALFDESGAPLIGAMAAGLPPSIFPEPAQIGSRATKSVIWHSDQGKYYRVMSAWAQVGRHAPRIVLMRLALDISIEQRLLAGYHYALLLTLILGAVCATTLGYLITRKGLQPIKRIAHAAREITSSRLDKKLELMDAPAELRELVTAFNDMLGRLGSSFAQLSQFSSDLAHELRTPINNLMGEAQVTLSRPRSSEEYHAVLGSIVEEFERLSRLIENMLFLARAENAQASIKPERLAAREELARLAEFYQLVADETGVRISCAGEAVVYADPILFRRAIGNLLSNAMRHCVKGGEIVMHAHTDSEGATEVSVANPGPAIPPEYWDRIFDRFFRVEASRAKSTEGAGLGLAIVQSILRLHNGMVRVASVDGGNTTFTLHFPPPPGVPSRGAGDS